MVVRLIVKAAACSALAFGVMVGCAHGIKKSEIASDADPGAELERVQASLAEGYENHYDVLAYSDFKKAKSSIKEAREDLKEGDENDEVLESIAYADAYLARAKGTAEERAPQIGVVLEAREKAIAANARGFDRVNGRLREADDRVRDQASDLGRLDAKKVTELQEQYLEIELHAINSAQLGSAQLAIEKAQEGDADDYTPAALKRAEIDFAAAKNAVRANRNDESAYSDAVAQANLSAEILTATLSATREGRVDEATAAKLVAQERSIAGLQNNLEDVQARAGETQSELEERLARQREEMSSQSARLATASAAVAMQQAIEKARQSFSQDEAEVFQQGDKLVIRLKQGSFPSGSSDLTPGALPVLAKVRDVAAGLAPETVVVEGHTDSTGSKAINERLSEARAKAVAEYLESSGMPDTDIETRGYGFEKPIASNRTAEGREQNRRVDIIVTPSSAALDRNASDSADALTR